MAAMTKQNIEIAIRKYLNEHLDFIPEVRRRDLFDVKIEQIFLSEIAYTGKDWYEFTGKGEGWIGNNDNKSSKRFVILPSKAYISGDENPIVEEIIVPVLITILP